MEYTTLAKVQDYLAITIDESLAEAVTSFIKAASSYICNLTGRDFTPSDPEDEDTTKVYDGNGTEKLEIDDCLEVTTLTVDGSEISAGDYFLYPANETPKTQIQLKNGLSRNSRQVLSQSFYTFTEDQQNVEVTGRFGYGEEIPADIELAATKLVGGILKEAVGDKDVKEITREALGDYSADYAKVKDVAHALSVDQLLAPYVREGKSAKTAVYTL